MKNSKSKKPGQRVEASGLYRMYDLDRRRVPGRDAHCYAGDQHPPTRGVGFSWRLFKEIPGPRPPSKKKRSIRCQHCGRIAR